MIRYTVSLNHKEDSAALSEAKYDTIPSVQKVVYRVFPFLLKMLESCMSSNCNSFLLSPKCWNRTKVIVSDKHHSSDCEQSEESIPRARLFLEKCPSQQRCKHWAAKGDNCGICEGRCLESIVRKDPGSRTKESSENEETSLTFSAYKLSFSVC